MLINGKAFGKDFAGFFFTNWIFLKMRMVGTRQPLARNAGPYRLGCVVAEKSYEPHSRQRTPGTYLNSFKTGPGTLAYLQLPVPRKMFKELLFR